MPRKIAHNKCTCGGIKYYSAKVCRECFYKNKSLEDKFCRDCGVLLNDKNWHLSSRKRSNICKECLKKLINKYRNTEKEKIKSCLRTKKFKEDIMKIYGGCCQCCKVNEIEFLTIDHINGDGNEHRKKHDVGTGNRFYRWLKKNEYPKEGFQILCYNCNIAKGSGKICPHQQYKVKYKVNLIKGGRLHPSIQTFVL